MTRYLSIFINGGRHGATALVSPTGSAELQQAAVPTGMTGVSYAMGWEVSRADGVPKLAHDGSTFNTHANVVLLPDRNWGVVVMENGENSPDEFFGSRRMTGIADGVSRMLIGEAPVPTSASTSLWVVYAALLGIVAIQIGGMARTVRTFNRWRRSPRERPTGVRIGLHLGLPLVMSLMWALIVLLVVPRIIRAPLAALLMGLPDLGYVLLTSAVVALGWGMARVIWGMRILRSTVAVGEPRARGQLANAHP
jgi:hypothetical protein